MPAQGAATATAAVESRNVELEKLCNGLEAQRLSASPRRFLSAAVLVGDIAACLRSMTSDADLAFAASALLGSEKSLLHFLRSIGSEMFDEAKVKALEVLADFIARLPAERLLPYAVPIKDTCLLCFRDKKAKVRSLSFRPVIALFSHEDLCNNKNKIQLLRDLKADFLLRKYLDPFHTSASKLSASVKRDLLHSIGLIASLSEAFSAGGLSTSVLNIFMSELRKQMEGARAPEMPTLEGVFNGLRAFLKTHPVTCSGNQRVATPGAKIYSYIKMAINPKLTATMTRFSMPRAALELLATHADKFREKLADEHEFPVIFEYLTSSCEHHNRDIQTVSFRALESFLQQISIYIMLHASNEAADEKTLNKLKGMFGVLMKRFKEGTQQQEGGSTRTTAISIRGYGYLAGPCKLLFGMDALKLMSNDLAAQCQQLFFSSSDDLEESIFHAGSFVDAIARLVQELKGAGDVFVPILQRLTALLLEGFPTMYRTRRYGAMVALTRCCVSLYHKGGTLEPFFGQLVFQLLLNVCALPIQEPDPATLETKTQSLNEFLVTLLEGRLLSNIPEEEMSTADRAVMLKVMYDETMKAFFKILEKLDLKTVTKQQVAALQTGKETMDSSATSTAMTDGEQRRVDIKIEDADASTENKSTVIASEKGHGDGDNNDSENGNGNGGEDDDFDDSLFPEKPIDFQLFVYLVSFATDLFESTKTEFFIRWVPIYCTKVITLSSKHEMVSGFYKLMSLANGIMRHHKYFDEMDDSNDISNNSNPKKTDTLQDMDTSVDHIADGTSSNYGALHMQSTKRSTHVLISKYGKDVVMRLKQYKDELLSACLSFVLSLPHSIIRADFFSYFPVLETALTLGLGYLPLAESALTALENWISFASVKEAFHTLLPVLDKYMAVVLAPADVDVSDEVKLLTKSITRKPERDKVVVAADNPFEALRVRILRLLGSLGGAFNHELATYATSSFSSSSASFLASSSETAEAATTVASPSASAADGALPPWVAWDTKEHLKFLIPFQEIKPGIVLDPLLPRIVELAKSSADRQSHVAACELLHSIVVLLIGNTTSSTSGKSGITNVAPIFKHLMPAMLELACDVDSVPKQLFEELSLQTIRWVTGSGGQRDEYFVIVDAVLDGLTNQKNSALREFSSVCVRELFLWAVKHTNDKKLLQSGVVRALLKRIMSMAEHPNAFQRIGAALALNHIYKRFREYAKLVDMYALDLTAAFLKSLALSHHDDPSMKTTLHTKRALAHLRRIITKKSHILVRQNPKIPRRRPASWLRCDLEYLCSTCFQHISDYRTAHRRECMEMFLTVVPKAQSLHQNDAVVTYGDPREWLLELGTEAVVLVVEEYASIDVMRKTVSNAADMNNGEDDGDDDDDDAADGAADNTTQALSKEKLLELLRQERKGASLSLLTMDAQPESSFSAIIEWMLTLSGVLEAYHMLLSRRLVGASEIFSQSNKIWSALHLFLSRFSRCSAPKHADTPKLVQKYLYVKRETMFRIIEFLRTFLRVFSASDRAQSACPAGLFPVADASLAESIEKQTLVFVATLVLVPFKLGFDPSDAPVAESLSAKTRALMESASSRMPSAQFEVLVSLLRRRLMSKECSLTNTVAVALLEGRVSLPLTKSIVAGYEHLVALDLLSEALAGTDTSTEQIGTELIERLFQFSYACPLDPIGQAAATHLLSLALTLAHPAEELMGRLLDTTPAVQTRDSVAAAVAGNALTQTSRGALFYDTFQQTLADYLGRNANELLPLVLSNVAHASMRRMLHATAARMQTAEALTNCREEFLRSFFAHFQHIRAWFASVESSDERVGVMQLVGSVLRCGLRAETAIKSISPSALKSLLRMVTQDLVDVSSGLTKKRHSIRMLGFLCQGDPHELTRRCAQILSEFSRNAFPLKSREYGIGTSRFRAYVGAIEDILGAMVESGSVELLEVAATIHLREPRTHAHESGFQRHYQQYIIGPNTKADKALEMLLQVFKKVDNPLFVRKNVVQQILATMLQKCSFFVCRNFFIQRLPTIVKMMHQDKKINTEESIVVKMSCFTLLEIMYNRLARSDLHGKNGAIVSAYCSANSIPCEKGNELTKAVCGLFKDVIYTTQEVRGDEAVVDLRRQASCAAYNALCTVITATQTEEKFYAMFCFKENEAKNQLIWQNLIDAKRKYIFLTELPEAMAIRTRSIQEMKRASMASAPSSSTNTTSPSGRAPRNARYYPATQLLAESSIAPDMNLAGGNNYNNNNVGNGSGTGTYGESSLPEGKDFDATGVITNEVAEERTEGSTVYLLNDGELEMDELNQHESMETLLRIIERIQSIHEDSRPVRNADGVIEPSAAVPKWLSLLLSTFESSSTPHNVKLFIGKAITNRPEAFQPWASRWMRPLLQLLLKFQDDPDSPAFNYFVTDICLVLLLWADTYIPESEGEKRLAKQVLAFLMDGVRHENAAVFKNNINVVRLLLEKWSPILRDKIPFKVIFNNMSSRAPDSKDNLSGLHLLSMVLANDMLPNFDDDDDDDVDDDNNSMGRGSSRRTSTSSLGSSSSGSDLTLTDYFRAVAMNLLFKSRSVFRTAASVAGMLLNHFHANGMGSQLKALSEIIVQQMDGLKRDDDIGSKERLIICLHEICNVGHGYPPLIDHFLQRVLFLAPTLRGQFQTMALECLLWRADGIPNLFKELRGKELINLIEHHHTETQAVLLSIIKVLLHLLEPLELEYLLPLITSSCQHHDESTIRAIMYDILMGIYDRYTKSGRDSLTLDEDSRQVLENVAFQARSHLILGLKDSSPRLRQSIVAYWDSEERLPRDPVKRMWEALSNLYVPEAEDMYLQFVTNILLQLSKHSPDYNREIFAHPLSACKWEPYHVDVSWQHRNAHMTPLFAYTQQSQALTDGEESDISYLASQSYMGSSSSRSSSGRGLIRATQASFGFTPTMASLAMSFEPGVTAGSVLASAQYTQAQQTLLFDRRRRLPRSSPLAKGVTASPSGTQATTTTTATTLGSSLGGLLAVPSQAAAREMREIKRLKRRFVRTRERQVQSAMFHAKRAAAARSSAQVLIEQRKRAHRSQVTLYRTYRKGELPDIQIKHSELVAPLQALAQRDTQMAKLVFERLFAGILVELPDILNVSEASKMRTVYTAELNKLLGSSRKGFAPFISTLHNLLKETDPTVVSPATTSLTSISSKSYHTGALLIESAIMQAASQAAHDPNASNTSIAASSSMSLSSTSFASPTRRNRRGKRGAGEPNPSFKRSKHTIDGMEVSVSSSSFQPSVSAPTTVHRGARKAAAATSSGRRRGRTDFSGMDDDEDDGDNDDDDKGREGGDHNRSRRAAYGLDAELPETAEASRWIHLGKLYKQLGDFDTLHGILTSQMDSPTTCEGAKLEASGDYKSAQALYRRAIWEPDSDESIAGTSALEYDLWEENLAECCLQLCDWRELENTTLIATALEDVDETVDPALDVSNAINPDGVWTRPQPWLNNLITAKVRSACRQEFCIETDPESPTLPKLDQVKEFLMRAKQHTDRWAMLQYHYSLELALVSVIDENYDLARFYSGQALQRFLGDWLNLTPLMVESRRQAVQKLQPLVELQEFLDFISEESNFVSLDKVGSFLSTWRRRLPSVVHDPSHVWDEITTYRRLYFNKLTKACYVSRFGSTAAESFRHDRDITSASQDTTAQKIRTILVLEDVDECLKMAQHCSQQGPLPIAHRYHKELQARLKLYKMDAEDHGPRVLQQAYGLVEFHFQNFRNASALQAREAESLRNAHSSHFGVFSRDLKRLADMEGAGIPASEKRGKFAYYKSAVLMKLAQVVPFCDLSDGNVGKACDTLNDILDVDRNDEAAIQATCYRTAFDTLIGAITATPTSPAALPVGWKEVPSKSRKGQFSYLSAFDVRIAKRPPSHAKPRKNAGGTANNLSLLFSSATIYSRECVDNFSRLAEFCSDVIEGDISFGEDEKHVKQVYIESMMAAMRSGDKRARQYFPRVLQLASTDSLLGDVLQCNLMSTPIWMLLAWIPQMLSLLDTKDFPVVYGSLVAIAQEYPQALSFPILLGSDTLDIQAMPSKCRQLFAKLKEEVVSDHLIDFVYELQKLTNPFTAMSDWLEEVEPLVKAADRAAIIDSFSTFKKDKLTTSNMDSNGRKVGTVWKQAAKSVVTKIFNVFGKNGERLAKMSTRDFHDKAGRQLKKLLRDQARAQKAGGKSLRDYSPYLADYQNPGTHLQLEIPGQYMADTMPRPEEHAMIESFDERLLVMASMRQPMRLKFRGSDEAEYPFLVKAGEDLRTDARVEQLFKNMNQILAGDKACGSRQLSLRTYNVIPMTTRIGMLEWMTNSDVLKNVIHSGMTQQEKDAAAKKKSPQTHFSQFVSKFMKKKDASPLDIYSAIMTKAGYSAIIQSFHSRESLVRATVLRDALLMMSTTPEAYLTTRQHFGRTLATMNTCQYILGIGDRHLSNTMIDQRTGGVIGIDFGHHFGSATELLPIPELIPFRLTRLLVSVFLPHTKEGLLAEVMTHVLRALQREKKLLLSTMDVFVVDPSKEWQSTAGGNVRHYAQQKLLLAKQKLSGFNSAAVMREEFKGNKRVPKFSQQWAEKVFAAIAGTPERNIRARLPESGLSVEEQVHCLLDHATDPLLLGVTWAGWEPWM